MNIFKNTSLIVLLFASMLFAFCADELTEINKNPKLPTTSPPGLTFTQALTNYFYIVSDCNVNRNNFRLYAQYWAQAQYPQESRYNFLARNIPGNYTDYLFRGVYNNAKVTRTALEAESAISATQIAKKNNKIAITKILKVLAFQAVVDVFGNVPYTEAVTNNPTPVYDDAMTIYKDLFATLDSAINEINTSHSGFSSTQDVVYGGDMSKWLKLVHSLKLRLAMRLADVDASYASSVVSTSYDKAFSSRKDNFTLTYPGGNVYSPLYENLEASGRTDFVAANTIVDIMSSLSDPRRSKYFQSNLDTTKSHGVYLGGIYGSANSASFEKGFSRLSSNYYSITYGPPLLSYTEVLFLLAEAKQRGFNVGAKTAKQYYDVAITESILEWGGTATEATTYLSNDAVAYDATNWKKSIGTQKWIAMFYDGLEGWSTWRKFDYPILNVPEDLTYNNIPKRMPYPIAEGQLNVTNYTKASQAIGGDASTTKLFWDRY